MDGQVAPDARNLRAENEDQHLRNEAQSGNAGWSNTGQEGGLCISAVWCKAEDAQDALEDRDQDNHDEQHHDDEMLGNECSANVGEAEQPEDQTHNKSQNVPNASGLKSSDDRPFACPTCPRSFKRKPHLYRHVKTQHAPMMMKTDEISGNEQGDHLKIEQTARHHICYVCNKVFNRFQSLRVHQLIHPELRQEKCKTCSKFFLSPVSCKAHESKCQAHVETAAVQVQTKLEPENQGEEFIGENLTDEDQACLKSARPVQVLMESSTHGVTCRKCKKRFRHHSDFEKHNKVHNSVRFACHLCQVQFNYKNELDEHLVNHPTIRSSPRRMCTVQLKKARLAHASGQKNHDDGLQQAGCSMKNCFTCGFCRKEIASEDFMIHTKLHLDRCETCKESLAHLQSHLMGEQQLISTSECGRDGSGPSMLKNVKVLQHLLRQPSHLKEEVTDAGGGQHDYQCETCHKTLPTRRGLVLHRKKHVKKEPRVCSICSKTYKSAKRLKSHMRHRHQKKCFSRLMQLSQEPGSVKHEPRGNLVTDGLRAEKKPFQCDMCNKSYSCKQTLQYHKVWHTESKYPYKCSWCQKASTWPSALTNGFCNRCRKVKQEKIA